MHENSKNSDKGRIVVGIDRSPGSIAALKEAQRIAQAMGSWLDVVECWAVPSAVAVPSALGAVNYEEGAKKLLQETVTSALGSPLPSNVSTSLVNGQSRRKLVEMSEGADMLVVGRRGHGGFAGLLLGSVSQACVAYSHCPVLVVNMSPERK